MFSKVILLITLFASMGFFNGVSANSLHWIDISHECPIDSTGLFCEVKKGMVRITLRCETNLVWSGTGKNKKMYCDKHGTIKIDSNVDIKYIKIFAAKKLNDNRFETTKTSNGFRTFDIDGNHRQIVFEAGAKHIGYYSPSISHIAISSASALSSDSILGYFRDSKAAFVEVLKHTVEKTEGFKAEIAASHQGHLDRYLQSLGDCIGIAEDERDFSMLDWRIQECSRRVVVFGIVLKELLNDYGHVDRLQTHIETIENLTTSLRASYGWDRGLAGSASKASGALLEVIKFELQEILSIKISSGATNFEQYLALIQDLTKLIAKINASRAGDLVVQRYIWPLVDTWNSEGWQNELSLLIGAPADEKKLVLPKLQLLLMAVESLNDLVNVNFKTPEIGE